MQNLKELSAFQNTLKSSNQDRVGQSKAAYAKGMRYLEQYTNKPTREILKKAIVQFQDAIKHSRVSVAPYIALGNLYFGMQLPNLALMYFKAAQELAPRSEYVLQLQKLLTSGEKIPTFDEAPTLGKNPGEVVDYDQLYDEVSALIVQELREVMAIRLSFRPTLSPDIIPQLKQLQVHLQESRQSIGDYLEILEAELDTSNLKKQLYPLETRQNQINRLLDQCLIFQGIAGQIHQLQARVREELKHTEPTDENLETFLDQCDALADQIDGLEEKGLPIHELGDLYRHLVSDLSQLQDLLD